MPTICMFYGIIISMRYREHNPPHFHARYQDYMGSFDFDGTLLAGAMPPRQCKLIAAWAELHRDELEANWLLALDKRRLFRIKPLV